MNAQKEVISTAQLSGIVPHLRTAKHFKLTPVRPDGAVIESEDGHVDWYPFQLIRAVLGDAWLSVQLQAVGFYRSDI